MTVLQLRKIFHFVKHNELMQRLLTACQSETSLHDNHLYSVTSVASVADLTSIAPPSDLN
jgi:hypothetical protein